MEEIKKISEVILSKGEKPEDYLDIDDGSLFDEEPAAVREVVIRYE